ncbi:DLW-39 family protein [Arthrobacter sp. EH-1B-1]|uniref:DLW-39 family protein n=1 Tax=Arthrobacter vasquezii TaxID=2977629 RepID=A0ABT6CU07_9MICC|nr:MULTISPECIES: DLW-39 family protein [Arthrobacter]MDF9277536.1 DLW-39 family protein [Arthrobacter vasquezii]
MKKLLVAAAAVAGVFAYKRWQESEKEKEVWSSATDPVE